MGLVIDFLEARAPAALRAEAHRSLAQGLPDDKLVAQWIVNFLKEGQWGEEVMITPANLVKASQPVWPDE
ncbi:MAG: hypothetical protein HC875_19970 [Anaerolineales bacterium]|nr:hypothetical protein [Anaerolineales bacterium]